MIPGKLFTVYKVVNNANSRCYYGRTGNPEVRHKYHRTHVLNGRHHSPEMVKENTKAGWEFVVIADKLSQKAANELSDTLAKEDPNPYNKLGIIPSNTLTSFTKKLSDRQVARIRKLYATGKHKQNDLAKKYNVTQGLISLTVNGLVHNAGEYTPPHFEYSMAYAPFKNQRQEMRALYMKHMKFVTRAEALGLVSKKFKCSVKTTRHWIDNEPNERNQFERANLYHKPSDTRITVNGEPFLSRKQWGQRTKRNPRELIRMEAGIYITRENRIVLINGVPHKTGHNLATTLKALGRHIKIRDGEYELIKPGLSKVEQNHKAARAKARLALKDPVLINGRMNIRLTIIKHGVSGQAMKAVLAERA